MKKANVKKWMAVVLSASMIASAATLFTGCGKNEGVTVPDMQMSVMSSAAATLPVSSEPISLNGFVGAIVDQKQYTVTAVENEAKNNYALFHQKELAFCLTINSPIEADGFTFTKTGETIKNIESESEWEISFNGTKVGECTLNSRHLNTTDDWWDGKTNLFNISAKPKKEASAVDYSGIVFKDSIDKYEFDVPAMMTEEDCKQHLPELEKFVKENDLFTQVKDREVTFEGVYFCQRQFGKSTVNVLVSVYTTDDESEKAGASYIYPFMDGEQPNALYYAPEVELPLNTSILQNFTKLS